ncbi:hypothetical protein [Streptomyces sp. NPDC048611]|uniref:hypothetical protein n=1 Tax=Streptomyces sp. NPDC048611 TaxID=3155635 RepID=UPI003431EE7F
MADAAAHHSASAAPRRVGAWFAVLAVAAAVAVLPVWLFCPDPVWRQRGVLVALGAALCCLVAIALCQRVAGGRRSFHTVAAAELRGNDGGEDGVNAPDVPDAAAMPLTLPSRRGMQWRFLGWGVGATTVVVSLVALVGGSPQRPERMQRIHDAGAEFAKVPIEKVSDVQFHEWSKGTDYYTATAVVRLGRGADGAPVTATVYPTSHERLGRGDRAPVLYAPARPQLGAIAGDERRLGDALRGDALPVKMVWLLLGAWAVGMGLTLAAVSNHCGFRSFTRLGKADKAVRARCLGPDFWRGDATKERCLKMVTASSRTAHFLVNVTEEELPDSLNGRHLWLCWDARRGTGGKSLSPKSTPAALISDDGWVRHGMLKVDDARLLADEGVAVDSAGVAKAEAPRALRLWDPRSAWLLYVPRAALTSAALLIACGALLTWDIPGFWRWVTGFGGLVAGGALTYFSTMHEPPPSPGTNAG